MTAVVATALALVRDDLLLAIAALERDDIDAANGHAQEAVEHLRDAVAELREAA